MRLGRSVGPWDSRSGLGLVALLVALSPALAAIWLTPAFTTQDGPAHLLNARILVESIPSNSPLRQVYAIRWSPLPNWAGHLALMGLSTLLSPTAADHAMSTIALMGLALATFWLRLQVSGVKGSVPAGILAALLAMNVCWLFGFWSFLLGACLFPLTTGIWWKMRSQKGLRLILALAMLVTLGYFGHLISLGVTVGALILLEVFTPSKQSQKSRLATLAGLLPLAILIPVYRRMMRNGGGIVPIWGHIQPIRRASWWKDLGRSVHDQLGWVDPISLGHRDRWPFLALSSPWLAFFVPATLIALLMGYAIITTLPHLPRERLGWAVASLGLLIGGVCLPDTLGESHGNYLPQRVVLLGLVSLVAWLDLDSWGRREILVLLVAAAVLQGLTVCDYARESSDRVTPFLNARDDLGRNQRIGTLLIGIKGRFRSNPLLHADNWLGVGTGNCVWDNYETIHYYFPVQFLDHVPRPPAGAFEQVAKLDGPGETAERASLWGKLLADHHGEIDVLIVWGRDADLEAINARWFDPTPFFEEGPLRAYRRRETKATPPGS